MSQVTNGVPATLRYAVTWRKSSHSNPYGNCVELAALAGGGIAVRNSREPAGSSQVYTRSAMTAFVRAVKEGEFEETAQ